MNAGGVCTAGNGDPQQDHFPAGCGRRGAERPGIPAPPRHRWPVMRPLVTLAWAICIASGHAARPKDTSTISLQPLGRMPALQVVTGPHNS